jgi:hypothetical protein
LKFPLVGKGHTYLRRAVDHVIVGEDVAFRADHHAGTQTLLTMIPRLRQGKVSVAISLATKELAEERHHVFRGARAPPDDLG